MALNDFMRTMSGGGGFNAGDPFARGAGAGTTGLLRQGGQYGFFNPGGSDQFRALQRRRILGMGRNRRNRASLLARLSGQDRMGAQNALQESERDQADFQSGALNDFDVSEYAGNRDFFRNLLGQERGFEEERRRRKEERDAQGSGFWGGLGSLAGQGALAYLTGGLGKKK